jgi:hypothetical protein
MKRMLGRGMATVLVLPPHAPAADKSSSSQR